MQNTHTHTHTHTHTKCGQVNHDPMLSYHLEFLFIFTEGALLDLFSNRLFGPMSPCCINNQTYHISKVSF